MSSTQPSAPAPAAVPLHLDAAGSWCFGWYHPPARPAGRVVVMCRPLGYEAISSYPTYVQIARAFADAGLGVLRFDYPGTGDSAGDDDDPRQVAAWVDATAAAVARARELSGGAEVTLFGVRLGATLALQAAAAVGGVESLLLWAPCATGKAFVRELRAAGAQEPDGGIASLGYRYPADTVNALLALDPAGTGPAPARRALVIPRDDLPGDGPLPKALRARGVATEVRALPGYAAMVQEPRQGVLSADTLAALTAWLGPAPAAGGSPVRLPAPAPRVTGGVRETPLHVGAAGQLFGVLSEPDGLAPERRGQTAILLLNVGGNYRVGPHRIYVTAARAFARAGYRTLRLDLGGIGDSPPAPGAPYANLYCKDSTQDVRAAIDTLAARGCRDFVVMGICSGSYVAFQTALVDPRIGAQVLMNSRLLEWNPGQPGDTWQDSMQQYVKSTGYYRKALWQPRVWWRLLRGEVHVRAIGLRIASLAAAWLRRAWDQLLRQGSTDGLLAKMKAVCNRGTGTLMLIADADDGRDYVEFHFGAGGRALRGHDNFRMVMVEDADHTFSRPASQAFVIDAVLRYLDARRPGDSPAGRRDAPAPGPRARPVAAAGGPLAAREAI